MFSREEVVASRKYFVAPTRLGVLIDKLQRRLVQKLFGKFSIFCLYWAMAFSAIVYVAGRLVWFGQFSKQSSRSKFLRFLFLKAFRMLGALRYLLPEAGRIGGTALYASQKIFFGIWNTQLQLEYLSRFFADYRPDLIVLPEQNCGYGHEVLIAWSRQSDVPILVLPYTIAGQQEWVASFSERPECQVRGTLRRLLAKAFPEWVYDHNGSRLILPLQWMFSCEYLGCPPAIPWVTNSGPDVRVAVDNLFVEEFYRREGVDTSRWAVVGSLAEDRLYHAMLERIAIRTRIASRLDLDPHLPIILIGLPPDQFDMGLAVNVEFADYRSLTEFIIGAVTEAAGKDHNVVVNLHPRIRREDAAYIEAGPARIDDVPIEDILPAAHLYISVASATIRWAIACGVPTINYDAYRYDYCDYHGLEGVVDVKTCEQFRKQLASIIDDNTYHDRLVQAQAADAARLFRLDGKAEERIIGLMAALCNAPRSAAAEPSVEHEEGSQPSRF